MIEVAEIMLHKADEPDVLTDVLDVDIPVGEHSGVQVDALAEAYSPTHRVAMPADNRLTATSRSQHTSVEPAQSRP